ncbi:MAG: hypothetical protein ACOX50_02580 [Patescibacteria group bacterium]|jgi:hypothetical protein
MPDDQKKPNPDNMDENSVGQDPSSEPAQPTEEGVCDEANA